MIMMSHFGVRGHSSAHMENGPREKLSKGLDFARDHIMPPRNATVAAACMECHRAHTVDSVQRTASVMAGMAVWVGVGV